MCLVRKYCCAVDGYIRVLVLIEDEKETENLLNAEISVKSVAIMQAFVSRIERVDVQINYRVDCDIRLN